jgi:hypothetical protein
MAAKTFCLCRVMRPDFMIEEHQGPASGMIWLALWTWQGKTYSMTASMDETDRMTFIGRCYDTIREQDDKSA